MIIYCSKKEETGLQSYSVDKNTDKNQIFKSLDKEKDFHFINESRIRDLNSKRTSNVELKVYNKNNQTKINYDKLICYVDFLPSINSTTKDTLAIFIGNFDGYSGNSISIKLFKKYYKMNYFDVSDVKVPKYLIPKYNTTKSELILEKNNYEIGDSIYGYLNFKGESDSTIIEAKGYFRCIVDNNLTTL
ncbi:MAG TPA: hypothetical protein VKY36_02490 [Moheibacter sp.]|nr:hypothetical protein [Moheibacter sp.]